MKDPERKPLNVSKRQPVSEKEQIKQSQHELTYLKQAMAFPKNFFFSETQKSRLTAHESSSSQTTGSYGRQENSTSHG